MKFCFNCGHSTGGEPLFCNFCGRSYDVKLCPRKHVNPRFADICSQCGSRELSTPQPKVSLWWKVLGVLLRVVVGAFLIVLSIVVTVELLRTSVVQNSLVVMGLFVAILWALWIVLPEWLRKLIHWLIRRRDRHDA